MHDRPRRHLPYDTTDDRGHQLVDRSRIRRGAVPVGEQQVPGPHEGGREHVDIGVRRDAALLALGGEVGGDHRRGLREDRYAGRYHLVEPGTQVIAGDDQAHDHQGDRPEHGSQRAG